MSETLRTTGNDAEGNGHVISDRGRELLHGTVRPRPVVRTRNSAVGWPANSRWL